MSLTETPPGEIGSSTPAFTLQAPLQGATLQAPLQGATYRMSDYLGRPTVVMFICNHCPFVRHIADHLSQFVSEQEQRGVVFLAINSNDASSFPQDGPQAMAEEARRRGYTFPYLFDEDQTVAQSFGAVCTPDFFVFDGDHRLVYRGRYDASRPGNDHPVDAQDIRSVIDAILSGSPVPVGKPSMGCSIKWKH